MNYFEELNKINVNDKTEERNGLTYLSWAWAWGELKKRYPMSYYTVHENKDGLMYHHDNRTAWVKTGVTVVDGEFSLEHIEYLPVMDFRNKSIGIDSITSFDVNKAIQRSLTKAIARHGLGLYIYAGEDLPDGEVKEKPPIQVPGTVISTRNNEIKELLKETGKTPDDYKALANGRSVATMSPSEYADWFKSLKSAWS
jgi:hypothetical protein